MSGALGDLEHFLDIVDVHLQVEADGLLDERYPRVRFRDKASSDEPIQSVAEADALVALEPLDGSGNVIGERHCGSHALIVAS